jgi:short-subunit dehydrogenase
MENVVLITGGSEGIGLALAKRFARSNFNLLLVARDNLRLEEAKQAVLIVNPAVQVLTLSKDLREEGAAEDIYGYCRENNVQVEVLCNNAGVGSYGPFSESFVEDNENIIQIDINTMVNLTYLFLHDMLMRRHGYILNTASTAAFQCGPYMDVYYAAKAFVLSFTEGLHEETKYSGVKVSALCPGPTATKFSHESGFDQTKIKRVFPLLSPERVADRGYKGLMKNKALIIPGFKNRCRAFETRLFSRRFIRGKMRVMLSPVEKKDKK